MAEVAKVELTYPQKAAAVIVSLGADKASGLYQYMEPEEIEALTLEVTVSNAGALDGDEVVECYIRDEEASVSRPRWSLCAFTRLRLKAGECRRISLEIRPEAMAVVQEDGHRVVEPGDFTLFIGGSQPDVRSTVLLGQAPLEGRFVVVSPC